MNNKIEIKKLSNNYIFNNFNIAFPMEKLIYLSGPNNSGKTTLIKAINKKIEAKYNILINNKEIDKSNILEYYKAIKCIIPTEINFKKSTLEEEIQCNDKKIIKEIDLLKKLKLDKYLKMQLCKLDQKTKIKLQLLLVLLTKPKLILIDNIMSYFNKKEVIELNNILKEYIKEYKTTIVITTINLNDTLNSDYLIIMSENRVELEGKPIEVLEKDNIVNKLDLDLPFMVDLSSKLRDYSLIEKIIIDKEELINTLWK